MHKLTSLFLCLLLVLSGCAETVSSQGDAIDQAFCIKLPISEFSSYSAAYTPAQCLSKENKNPKVIEKVDQESLKIWKEIHEKMHLTTPYVPIVVYGSLMNPISAKNTLQEYHSHAVWIHDYVRVFNLDTRLFGGSSRVTDVDGEDNRGALNLNFSQGESCNGIVLAISEDDFVSCRRREGVYNCVPVVISDYVSSGQCHRSVAYAWVAGDQVCSNYVLPLKSYYSMIWEGITADSVRESFGDNFSQEYLNTTFLADGRSIKTIHDEYKDAPIHY
ncbi:hypothetical protein [Chlamydia felis Fe/C-56]|uniref:Lipoprotein n=1 Tax=Chlamydia felis (strain Fe/C-56) TaxID=264202 RepID=Q254U0_CHLFF|nr:gamma-glutamylcyclotransferase family protein [Chlamydia felis]BAE81198.1 hypothetical protein [Chlamydia felis Fe/C-56]